MLKVHNSLQLALCTFCCILYMLANYERKQKLYCNLVKIIFFKTCTSTYESCDQIMWYIPITGLARWWLRAMIFGFGLSLFWVYQTHSVSGVQIHIFVLSQLDVNMMLICKSITQQHDTPQQRISFWNLFLNSYTTGSSGFLSVSLQSWTCLHTQNIPDFALLQPPTPQYSI